MAGRKGPAKPKADTKDTGSTRDAREVFLDHLRKTSNISQSASIALVERKTVYRWREADPAFAAAWDDAIDEATDMLEAEARRRAIEGDEEYVVSMGQLVRDPKYIPLDKRRPSVRTNMCATVVDESPGASAQHQPSFLQPVPLVTIPPPAINMAPVGPSRRGAATAPTDGRQDEASGSSQEVAGAQNNGCNTYVSVYLDSDQIASRIEIRQRRRDQQDMRASGTSLDVVQHPQLPGRAIGR